MADTAIVFEAHDNYVLDLKFTPDSSTLISCGMDALIRLWSAPGWRHETTLAGHEKSVNSLSLSADGRTLASGSTDGTVRLWTLPGGHLQHTMEVSKKTVAAVAIGPGDDQVASASYGGKVAIWRLDGAPLCAFKASKKNLSSVTYAASNTLVVSGLGGELTLWSLPEGEAVGTLAGHATAAGHLHRLDTSRLLSLGYEGDLRVWDVARLQLLEVVQLEPPGARGLALSPDRARAAVSFKGMIQLRTVADWAVQRVFDVRANAIYGMAFSPDGSWLAAGAADKKIRVWAL